MPALVSGAVLLGVAVSLGAAARRRRQQGAALDEQAPLAAALDEIVVDGLDDLHSERDPRLAVIRAYARMLPDFLSGFDLDPPHRALDFGRFWNADGQTVSPATDPSFY